MGGKNTQFRAHRLHFFVCVKFKQVKYVWIRKQKQKFCVVPSSSRRRKNVWLRVVLCCGGGLDRRATDKCLSNVGSSLSLSMRMERAPREEEEKGTRVLHIIGFFPL